MRPHRRKKTVKFHVRSEDKKRGIISYRTWPFSSFAAGGKLALIVYFSTSISAETWFFYSQPFSFLLRRFPVTDSLFRRKKKETFFSSFLSLWQESKEEDAPFPPSFRDAPLRRRQPRKKRRRRRKRGWKSTNVCLKVSCRLLKLNFLGTICNFDVCKLWNVAVTTLLFTFGEFPTNSIRARKYSF